MPQTDLKGVHQFTHWGYCLDNCPSSASKVTVVSAALLLILAAAFKSVL